LWPLLWRALRCSLLRLYPLSLTLLYPLLLHTLSLHVLTLLYALLLCALHLHVPALLLHTLGLHVLTLLLSTLHLHVPALLLNALRLHVPALLLGTLHLHIPALLLNALRLHVPALLLSTLHLHVSALLLNALRLHILTPALLLHLHVSALLLRTLCLYITTLLLDVLGLYVSALALNSCLHVPSLLLCPLRLHILTLTLRARLDVLTLALCLHPLAGILPDLRIPCHRIAAGLQGILLLYRIVSGDAALLIKRATVNPVHCGGCRMPMVKIGKLAPVMPCGLLVSQLRSGGSNVPFPHCGLFPRGRPCINTAGAVVAVVIIACITYKSPVDICISDNGTIYIPYCGIIHKSSAAPASAVKAYAAIPETVVNAAVVANANAPVTIVKSINAVHKAPVGRSP
jgi:hypothetical protein